MEYTKVRSRRRNQKAIGKIQVRDDGSLGKGGLSGCVRGWILGIFEGKANTDGLAVKFYALKMKKYMKFDLEYLKYLLNIK